ncbi:hypothetical protein WICPIJ_008811 [Wickerhamomyces pijperi]|uniref:Core Histone H2A/H2B/H3 domain-containing protein n=1 Tax=Wickerhamomyces pijperi TaxID=599730 RepID=A0A9P8PX51_WICPI|nr:hypothetical protein WICPIJ_008811 [Wickerhamomyces pijperi]
MDDQYKFEASAYLNQPVDDEDEEDVEVETAASLISNIPHHHIHQQQHQQHFSNVPEDQHHQQQQHHGLTVGAAQGQTVQGAAQPQQQQQAAQEEQDEGEEAEQGEAEEEEDEDMMGDSAFANVAQGLTGHYRNLMMNYWQETINSIEHEDHDFKNHQLPLARIKKVMKTDDEVKMISAEAPILFAKGCDIFITELTMRAWIHAEENKRRTLQRSDIAAALQQSDMFDFLIDIVPREEEKKTNSNSNSNKTNSTVPPARSNSYGTQTYTNHVPSSSSSVPGSAPGMLHGGLSQQHDLSLQNMIFDSTGNNDNSNSNTAGTNQERTFIQENVIQQHNAANDVDPWSV